MMINYYTRPLMPGGMGAGVIVRRYYMLSYLFSCFGLLCETELLDSFFAVSSVALALLLARKIFTSLEV